MNTQKNNSFFRHISLLILTVYSISIVGFVPPKVSAQENATRESRLTISLGSAKIQLEQKDSQSTQKLLIHDYLSSTKAVISESGEVSTYPSYYPYGSSIAQTPVDMTDKQYTGQKKVTDDSSVYNYNARYYNPTTAIFIQPDTVRGPGRYTYVSGNPIQGTDPSGYDVCQQDPSLSFLWNALGQCGNAQGEDFMGEKGLGSVGTLMAAAEAGSGGIGGLAAAIGDKISGNSSGSESINSAYASLSGGASAGILAMGMLSPDPGDGMRIGRSARSTKAMQDLLSEFHAGQLVTDAGGFTFSSAVSPLQEGMARFYRGIEGKAINSEFLEPATEQAAAAFSAIFPDYSSLSWKFREKLKKISPKLDKAIFSRADARYHDKFMKLAEEGMGGGKPRWYTQDLQGARDWYTGDGNGLLLYFDAPMSEMMEHLQFTFTNPKVTDAYLVPYETLLEKKPKIFGIGGNFAQPQ